MPRLPSTPRNTAPLTQDNVAEPMTSEPRPVATVKKSSNGKLGPITPMISLKDVVISPEEVANIMFGR